MIDLRKEGIFILFLNFLVLLTEGKIYDKCELAIELRDRHFVPFDQIGIFVCIAERQSGLNTNAVGDGSYFGMYQIGSEFWCDRNYAGKGCGVRCSDLTDDDLDDDIRCVQEIYAEHERIFGNGFNAWPSAHHCQSEGNTYVQNCFFEDNQVIDTYQPILRSSFSNAKSSGNVDEGKVYERCELARELHYQHNIVMEQIATWVCIAKHESAFNTSAIGRLNWDGSEDHGLFQISDIYWCGVNGKACGAKCEEFRDNDIRNDVECIKKIHAEHQRLSGDGFNAWAVYPRCRGDLSQYTTGCFDSSENDILPYKPSPGIQQPKKNYVQTSNQRKSIVKPANVGKVYERCELAQELRFKYKIPIEQVSTWVCIAEHESAFNTSAIGRLNADGSEDHGLFQISDIYWCGETGKSCGVTCDKFEDSDIDDDVECIVKIYDEHQLLFGDGFNAWAVYRPHCQGRSEGYIQGCFGEELPKPAVTQPPNPWVYREFIRTSSTERGNEPGSNFVDDFINIPVTVRNYQPAVTQPTANRLTESYYDPPATEKLPETYPTTIRPFTTTTRFIPTTTKRIETTTRTIPTTTRTLPKTTPPKTSTTPVRSTIRFQNPAVTQPPTSHKTITLNEPATQSQTTLQTSTPQPIISTSKSIEKALIGTTINQPATARDTSTHKPTTRKSVEKSSTANSFNIFDLYFNSFPRGDIKPKQQKSFVTKSTAISTTKAPSARSLDREVKLSSEITTRRTTLVNTQLTTRRPFYPINNQPKSTSTTEKILKHSTITTSTALPKPDERKSPQTKRKAATIKPFNVYAFYLRDYTSRAPINYQPIQFSSRTTERSSTIQNENNPSSTTNRAIRFGTPTSTVRPLSIHNFNSYDDYGPSYNRIGRVVQNITPHSFEYLLRLTTPRT